MAYERRLSPKLAAMLADITPVESGISRVTTSGTRKGTNASVVISSSKKNEVDVPVSIPPTLPRLEGRSIYCPYRLPLSWILLSRKTTKNHYQFNGAAVVGVALWCFAGMPNRWTADGGIRVSLRDLADECCMSHPSVLRHLRYLERVGAIRMTSPGQSKKSVVYITMPKDG
jgi:hypothetical protein